MGRQQLERSRRTFGGLATAAACMLDARQGQKSRLGVRGGKGGCGAVGRRNPLTQCSHYAAGSLNPLSDFCSAARLQRLVLSLHALLLLLDARLVLLDHVMDGGPHLAVDPSLPSTLLFARSLKSVLPFM